MTDIVYHTSTHPSTYVVIQTGCESSCLRTLLAKQPAIYKVSYGLLHTPIMCLEIPRSYSNYTYCRHAALKDLMNNINNICQIWQSINYYPVAHLFHAKLKTTSMSIVHAGVHHHVQNHTCSCIQQNKCYTCKHVIHFTLVHSSCSHLGI